MNKDPLMIELDAIADAQMDRIAHALERIANSLEKIADGGAPEEQLVGIDQVVHGTVAVPARRGWDRAHGAPGVE